jgi:hypothetical protein
MKTKGGGLSRVDCTTSQRLEGSMHERLALYCDFDLEDFVS